MSTETCSLGEALAMLAAEQQAASIDRPAPPSAQEAAYLTFMRARLQEITAHDLAGAILTSLPSHRCHTDSPFLLHNQDYFLSRFLVKKRGAQKVPADCKRLFTHLNNCYPCFEVFCEVTQAYYSTSRQLT